MELFFYFSSPPSQKAIAFGLAFPFLSDPTHGSSLFTLKVILGGNYKALLDTAGLLLGCRTSGATEAEAVRTATHLGVGLQAQFWVGTLHERSAFDEMSPKMILLCISQASQGLYGSNLVAHPYFLIYKWRK